MKFEERSLVYRQYIQDYLKNFYKMYVDEPQKPLFEAMQYSLLAGEADSSHHGL